jgi:two-component system response regulator DegU
VARSRVRVLIVDDFKQFRAVARLIVLDELTRPHIAEGGDGRSAVRLAQQLQPHLILLDIGLPELNGLEAARQIMEVSPTSKIIFVTQTDDTEARDAALGMGAEAYVLKINSSRELPNAIRAALRDSKPPTSVPLRTDLSGDESWS